MYQWAIAQAHTLTRTHPQSTCDDTWHIPGLFLSSWWFQRMLTQTQVLSCTLNIVYGWFNCVFYFFVSSLPHSPYSSYSRHSKNKRNGTLYTLLTREDRRRVQSKLWNVDRLRLIVSHISVIDNGTTHTIQVKLECWKCTKKIWNVEIDMEHDGVRRESTRSINMWNPLHVFDTDGTTTSRSLNSIQFSLHFRRPNSIWQRSSVSCHIVTPANGKNCKFKRIELQLWTQRTVHTHIH